MQSFTFVLVCALLFVPEPAPAWKADTVKVWARTLGDEIWKLSEALTKSDQIRIKYKQMNASVKRKDGKQILTSSLESVSTMLTRKINAVKCIHATAERLAREFNYSSNHTDFEYCSAKYSIFYNEDGSAKEIDEDSIPKYVRKGFEENTTHYSEIYLEKDSHFYNISVNTNTSCVHVPTNIFDEEEHALNAILWSKELNDIFTKNYNSDPSLSWQYFGSSDGILRFYPGMPWNPKGVDTYDCRVKSWYIEAATCSKDMIILFDVSGSMTGFKNYVARRTLQSLLDTLSNNDFVNVYTFKNSTQRAVDCFSDLVQATPENLKTITDALQPGPDGKHKVPLDGNANLTTAFIKAFTALKERRVACNVTSTQGCNQLVMLITDYVPGNLTEVFEGYNRETVDNKTYTPVRVFTYLIGKEVTNVDEIKWMACLNRGYYVHIHSVEEVQQQVLKYINVIARPMILEKKDPPPTWTHANIDETRTKKWGVGSDADINKPDEDKLVTSVAIPAFDLKYNEENNGARLLGVAGTDVPIDSIAKLAQPHQLGVNGYSFIVSNNGYLLLHPLLITTINRELQKNYNSVDFVEVEQVDNSKGPRDVKDNKITELRYHLVQGHDGKMEDVEVLYHYDNMRRIARVQHDYFFNKLEGTPFSMGISLPKGYGDTELLLKENPLEARQGKELTGINVTDYFRYSYRVHPDWVYCKYHYLEGHDTPNMEKEAWNFLVGLSENKIDITKQQYPKVNDSSEFDVDTHCGSSPLGKNDYYCNEDLVKQLVFDAKLSSPYFEKWDASADELETALKYNVSVRFIATSSGLTRWHYIFNDSKNERVDEQGNRNREFPGDVFGDVYHNTIEETWYKAAVLQHMINKESLVIATPLPILDEIIKNQNPVINEDGDITITASYALFYKDGKSETPASVVGFQFSYLGFYERFLEITSVTIDDSKEPTCASDKYDCYVIDSSGYIVLDKDINQVGKFFGTVQPLVLQSFVETSIFQHVEMYNYQALCPSFYLKSKNRSWTLRTPFSLAFNFVHWLITEAIILATNVYNNDYYAYGAAVDDPDYFELIKEAYTEAPTTPEPPPPVKETITTDEGDSNENLFSCDHSILLYILNQTYFSEASGALPTVQKDEAEPCCPAYWASFIPKTNLLLVVVEKSDEPFEKNNCTMPRDTKPEPVTASISSREPCHKLELGGLPRRRLEGCYTYHEGEKDIQDCGRGSTARSQLALLIACVLVAVSKMAL